MGIRWGPLLMEVLQTTGPILGILLMVHLVILRRPLDNWPEIVLGLLLAALGTLLLVQGLRIGVIPLGESVASALVANRQTLLIILFALAVGISSTFAEPALITLASQVDTLTSGALNQQMFTNTVAVGVGLGTLVGTLRILFGIEATPVFIPALAIVLVLTYFAPERYTALAFDAAFATTGPLTVSLVIALGAGLATAMGRSDTLLYGFGLVTMAAMGPITSVLSLGIILGILGK